MSATPIPRRGRRWLPILLGGLLLLFLLAVLATQWLLRSESGLAFVLARATSALPDGALSIDAVRGTLAGGANLQGLRFRQNGTQVEVARIALRLQPSALLQRRIELAELRLQGVAVRLPEPVAPPAPAREAPIELPVLELPMGLRLPGFEANDVTLQRPDGPAWRIDRAQGGVELDAAVLSVSGLRVEAATDRLQLDLQLDTRRDYRHRLRGDWARAQVGESDPLQLELAADGDRHALGLRATGRLPGPLRLDAKLTDPLGAPGLTLDLVAEGLDPQHLAGGDPAEPLDVRLQAQGASGRFELQGELVRAGRRLGIAPSHVQFDAERLDLQPLVLELAQGRVELAGQVGWAESPLRFDASARWDGLRLEPDRADSALSQGQARLVGDLAAWTLDAEGEVRRGERRVDLVLQGTGDAERLQIATARAEAGSGRLLLDGELAWEPALAWDLNGRLESFDPGDFLADWPGAVEAELVARGASEQTGLRLDLQLPRLGGHLRGRTLTGSASLALEPASVGRLQAAVGIGASRIEVEGGVGETLDLDLTLAPLHLSDLRPDAEGRVAARLRLQGPAQAPGVQGRIEAGGLAWGDYALGRLEADLDLPPQAGAEAQVRMDWLDLGIAGVALESGSLGLTGSRDAHRIELDARSGARSATLVAEGGWDADWRGRVERLALGGGDLPGLQLEAPTALRLAPDGQVALDMACFVRSEGAGRLCLQAQFGATAELSAELEALPLALFESVLAEALDAPLRLDGSVAGAAAFQRSDGLWQGRAELVSLEGGLNVEDAALAAPFRYRDLRLAIEADTGWQATLAAGLGSDGRLEARLAAPSFDADAVLEGEADLRLGELDWLALLSPQLAATSGRAHVAAVASGTVAQPQLALRGELSAFAAEVPALGLALREGRLAIESVDARRLALSASLRSGPGQVDIRGDIDATPGASRPLQLRIEGSELQVADTLDVKARVSPAMEASLVDGQLRLSGRLDLPWARVDLSRIEASAAVSPDVEILDPEHGQGGADALPLRADIEVAMGEDVRLKGFGLDGRLRGALRVRERPGSPARGSGTLDVTGSYRGYGQSLRIVRGGLNYSASPLDNPGLNIRAQRSVREVTVGVQVRGTAVRPELSLWSEPAMDQAETLSWLVLGRPLRQASGEDGARLSAASLALGAGGNLLGERIGARLGLDEVGVSDSAALGGSAFTLGKYLSPRLYLGYGVSLFGSGQVLSLRYLLTENLNVEVDSGAENRAALNYRRER